MDTRKRERESIPDQTFVMFYYSSTSADMAQSYGNENQSADTLPGMLNVGYEMLAGIHRIELSDNRSVKSSCVVYFSRFQSVILF